MNSDDFQYRCRGCHQAHDIDDLKEIKKPDYHPDAADLVCPNCDGKKFDKVLKEAP